MNRLESGEPREVIIYKIIQDGMLLYMETTDALSAYISAERDEAINDYYDLLDRTEDTLEDAYREARKCKDADMKEVCRCLESYFQFVIQIFEDFSVCRLTDEDLERITTDAWYTIK